MKTLIKTLFLLLFIQVISNGQSEVVVEDIDDNGINFLTLRTQNPAPSNIYLFSDGISKKATLGTTQSGNSISFQTATGEKMRVTDSGRIGIGTASPLRDVHIRDVGFQNTILRLSNDHPTNDAFREIGIELYSELSTSQAVASDWRIMNKNIRASL